MEPPVIGVSYLPLLFYYRDVPDLNLSSLLTLALHQNRSPHRRSPKLRLLLLLKLLGALKQVPNEFESGLDGLGVLLAGVLPGPEAEFRDGRSPPSVGTSAFDPAMQLFPT